MTLDPPIFIERGEIASHEAAAPMLSAVVHARLFWLGRHPMAIGDRYRLKLGTQETLVEVEAIEQIIDSASLDALQSDAEPRARTVPQDAVAEVVMRARGLLALDSHAQLAATGRFVLLDGYEVVGGGLVEMAGYPDQRKLIAQKSGNLTAVSGRITHAMHQARNGHRGGVLWFTGLSGAGKSTLAIAVEHRLFLRGYQIYVLDGDNIRRGLNMNLGFSPDDRAENIRRVGEVAALFADAGMIVLSAFISPYRSDRDRAREAVQNLLGADNAAGFHEVYIKADLAACETRDPKGLYRRARAGEIREFTGISAPYEPPSQAELVVDTEHQTIEECVGAILAYVETHFPVRAR